MLKLCKSTTNIWDMQINCRKKFHFCMFLHVNHSFLPIDWTDWTDFGWGQQLTTMSQQLFLRAVTRSRERSIICQKRSKMIQKK